MKLLKRIRQWFRDWWNYEPDSLDSFLDRAAKANADEPQEIWQWQINCTERKYPRHRPMPKNFGLLIGTLADAEARLKASVSLLNHYETKVDHHYTSEVITYKFVDHSQDENPFAIVLQRGAIRCVSENMKLIKTGFLDIPHSIREFIVESDTYNRDFDFHPINISKQFIKFM